MCSRYSKIIPGMTSIKTSYHIEPTAIARAIIDRVGESIVLAIPLGIGKPNHIVNALYAEAVADPSIQLKIFTALTLERPAPSSELEKRFLQKYIRLSLMFFIPGLLILGTWHFLDPGTFFKKDLNQKISPPAEEQEPPETGLSKTGLKGLEGGPETIVSRIFSKGKAFFAFSISFFLLLTILLRILAATRFLLYWRDAYALFASLLLS